MVLSELIKENFRNVDMKQVCIIYIRHHGGKSSIVSFVGSGGCTGRVCILCC